MSKKAKTPISATHPKGNKTSHNRLGHISLIRLKRHNNLWLHMRWHSMRRRGRNICWVEQDWRNFLSHRSKNGCNLENARRGSVGVWERICVVCDDVWWCVTMCVTRCVMMCDDVWWCDDMCDDVWRCVWYVWWCVMMCVMICVMCGCVMRCADVTDVSMRVRVTQCDN